MTKKELYYKALIKWGVSSQIMVVFEELGELMQAIAKYTRLPIQNKGKTRLGIIEEIADVEIMLEQLKEIFDCYSSVAVIKENKLKRLERRLKK